MVIYWREQHTGLMDVVKDHKKTVTWFTTFIVGTDIRRKAQEEPKV